MSADAVAKTTFEKIWDGTLESWPIFRSDRHGVQVILDIYPAHPGHLLVIPREPVNHVFELEPQRHLMLFTLAQLASQRLKQVLSPLRVKYLASGYDIPHVHLHVLPSFTRSDVEEALEARSKVPAPRTELDAMQMLLRFGPELQQLAEHQLSVIAGHDLTLPR